MREWQEFRVGEPAIGNYSNPSCWPFNSVSHTTHVKQAIDIIRRKQVSSGLVYDKSKLNTKRILVSWLSPNTWYDGYRYGSIKFDFSFSALIDKKNFYWVESIAYNTPACRILITDKNRDDELERYDPRKKDGPWWLDPSSGQNYFNNGYCLEFMLEAPVSFAYLNGINFVKHHPNFCSLHSDNPQCCMELDMERLEAGALFLTMAVANEIKLNGIFGFVASNGSPIIDIVISRHRFLDHFCNINFSGQIKKESDSAMVLMKGVMSLFSSGDIKGAKMLASNFSSRDDFDDVSEKIITPLIGATWWPC